MNFTSRKFAAPHSFLARLIHWSFVVLFAYGIFKGLDNVEQLSDTAFLQFEMWFAGGFLVVIFGRFLIMRKIPSALPDTSPKLIKFLAKMAHIALYLAPAMIAISGMMIGALYSTGTTSGIMMDGVIWLHETSLTATYVLIAGHVAAALGHRFLGDGVWSSMVPIFKETPRA